MEQRTSCRTKCTTKIHKVIGGQGRNRTTDTRIFSCETAVRSTSPWHAELRWNKYLVEAGFSRLAVVTPGFAPVCNPGVTPEKRHVVTVSHPFQQNVTRTFVAAHTRKARNVLRHGR